jgi:hypothetical protein
MEESFHHFMNEIKDSPIDISFLQAEYDQALTHLLKHDLRQVKNNNNNPSSYLIQK